MDTRSQDERRERGRAWRDWLDERLDQFRREREKARAACVTETLVPNVDDCATEGAPLADLWRDEGVSNAG